MTAYSLARADALLAELSELVETARRLPMSSSCVIPRERTLDLLDALRAVLPGEMAESRRIVAQRERLLGEASENAQDVMRSANGHAESLVIAARAEADDLVKGAEKEQAQLVSSATVHQIATSQAARLRDEADAYAGKVREAADKHAKLAGSQADSYAAELKGNADGYADRTLSELVANLRRLAVTAENGRVSLCQRSGDGDEALGKQDAPQPM
jgi:cell division septum initiation protein DivIVA